MDAHKCIELMKQANLGYAYHELVFDSQGEVCDYRFLDANAEFGRVTGLIPQQIIGKTVREVLPGIDEDPFDWISTYAKIALEGGSFEFEGRSELQGKWYLIKAVSTERNYFSTLVFDISYYKRLEKKLSDNEERLRLLLENSNDWVLVLDKDFRIKYSTKLGSKILGMDIEYMKSLNVFSVIHPDDLDMARNSARWLFENPNQLTILELRVINTDGNSIWLEVFASNMISSPAINGYVINARDISERKETMHIIQERDKHLRHITDNITDVVFLTDKELNTIYVSPSIYTMLGETPEEHIRKSLDKKHPPDSLAIMQQVLMEELERDQDPKSDPNRTRVVDVQHFRKDGSLIDVSMHVSIVRDEQGHFNGLQGVTRDVSFQKRAERKLKEKNLYMESLLGAIPDPIFVLDKEGIFTDLKADNFEWLYVPESEISNQKLTDILPETISHQILDKIQLVLSDKRTQIYQYSLIQAREERDFEARISYLDEDHVISLVREITSEKRAVLSIKQQSLFQKMVSEISTTFVKSRSSSIDPLLDDCLKRIGTFFGVQRAYIYRYSDDYQRLIKTNEWCHPQSGCMTPKPDEYATSSLPWWHTMILSGKIIQADSIEDLLPEANVEYQLLRSQGISSILCIPIQTGTRVLGYFGFDSIGENQHFEASETGNLQIIANLLGEVLHKQDIQKQVQNQARMQEIISRMAMKYINLPSDDLESSIVNSLQELAMFSNVDRAYIYSYDWAAGICMIRNHWEREGLDSNAPLSKVIPIEYLEPLPSMHRAGKMLIYDDVEKTQIPEQLFKILQAEKVKSMIAIPLIQDGLIIGFVSFDFIRHRSKIATEAVTLLSLFAQLLVNVHNRRSLENTLIKEKERAEAASRAKSEFLANMSHEIRTPLNGVIGFAELLFNSGLDDAQNQYARNIVNSSYSLLGIISDILDFSKIEAGKLELAPAKTDLIELVEHATDIVKVRTGQKELELLLDIAPDLPRYAIIDPLRLNQILINLLSNAEKFTDEGEVELKVSHKQLDADHAEILFSVRDTGIGIDPSKQKRLFRAFSQLDSSTTRKYGGTGLGLVISNHLANLMGSKIEMESSPGSGSIFSIRINCRVEGDAHCHKQPLKLKRILLIDDNAKSLSNLKQCIDYWGINSVTADSGNKALKILANDDDFNAIVIDYSMPELDGLETIRMIRKLNKPKVASIALILIHNSAEDAILQNGCIELDIRHRLIKPVKANDLYDQLLKIDNRFSSNKSISKDPTVKQHIQRFQFATPPRILIVEDNFLNMALLKEMILQLMPQTEILQASDGLQAVDRVRKNQLDLVMMDVQMPNMDGVAASKEIRKFSDIPIIAITAGALKEEQERCIEAGMNAFLTKPVLANELCETLLNFVTPLVQDQEPDAEADPAPATEIHFNKAVLLKNISGDEETLKNLLDITRDTFPEKILALEHAIDNGDEKEMKSILHSLKGSAQNMHFDRLGKLAAEFELAIQELSPQQRKDYHSAITMEWREVLNIIK